MSTLELPESAGNGSFTTGSGSKGCDAVISGGSGFDGWGCSTSNGVASTADSGMEGCEWVVSGGFSGTGEDDEGEDASTGSPTLPSASLVLMMRLPEPKLTASELRRGAAPDRPFGNAGTGSSVEKLEDGGPLDNAVPAEMHLFLGPGDSSDDGRGDPERLPMGAPLGLPRPGTRLP